MNWQTKENMITQKRREIKKNQREILNLKAYVKRIYDLVHIFHIFRFSARIYRPYNFLFTNTSKMRFQETLKGHFVLYALAW